MKKLNVLVKAFCGGGGSSGRRTIKGLVWLKCVICHKKRLYNRGDQVVCTCSLSSVSCPDRLATSLMVDSSFSCRFLISFCSPSPSLLTRDMARIRGNQSRLCSWWTIKQTSDFFQGLIFFVARMNKDSSHVSSPRNLPTSISTLQSNLLLSFQKHPHSLNITNLQCTEPMKIFKREKRRWEVTDLHQTTRSRGPTPKLVGRLEASWKEKVPVEKFC